MRGRGPRMGSQGGGHFMQRHRFYMRGGLPPAYAVLSNPLTATSSILSGGADLYAANCASCYGSNGYGDGDAGQSLVPPPANIAATARMPMMADSFLYWSIAEGRSEEHTSELQSLMRISYAVFCLKKKK